MPSLPGSFLFARDVAITHAQRRDELNRLRVAIGVNDLNRLIRFGNEGAALRYHPSHTVHSLSIRLLLHVLS